MNKLFSLIILLFCITHQIKAVKIPTKEEKKFYERLYKLTAQGNIDSVKVIMERDKVNLSKYDRDNQHYTPILYAATWSGNKELVQYLIDKGADPKAKTSSNETALHRAAWNGNQDIVKLLVSNGADVNIIYNANGGLSPLCCAAESGNIDVVKYLISKGADVNYTNESSGASPLRSAAYTAHYDIFVLLADMQPVSYNWQDALFYGLIGGNLNIVKYVVEKKGAIANAKSEVWGYAIEKAANNKYIFNKNAQPVEIVKYLVSKGAKLSNINKGNVFEWAMINSTEETIEYLIEQGVKVTIPPSEDGWTPLALALDNGSFALAKHLIRNTKDHTFRGSPLIVYFSDGMYNSPDIINLLIEEGVNKKHYTEAFKRSVARNDSVSAHLLLNAGADIKELNEDDSNVLHLTNSYRVAKFLIENGVDTQNKVMLDNAWKNPALLQALEEVDVYPPIFDEDMDKILLYSAQQGDEWTLKYILKRGANVNCIQQPPSDYVEEDEEEEEQEDNGEENDEYERYEDDDNPTYNQTPLIKNAIQGYAHCDYGRYSDDGKVQISSQIAKLLIEAGADLNATDAKGRTALHYTAMSQWCRVMIWPIPMGSRRDREHGAHGDPAAPPLQHHDLIAYLLIKSGAHLNMQDKKGNTPLIYAAKGRNYAVLKMLLEAGADHNIKNKRGRMVFDYLDDKESFKVLKEAGLGKYISQKRVDIAFQRYFTDYRPRSEYNTDDLKALIAYGANVNSNIYSGDTNNGLMYTFDRMYGDNKFENAQALIDGGINLNAEDRYGYTLLMQLVKEGKDRDPYSQETEPVNLQFLLKNKVNLNYKSSRQYTALGVAICEGKEEIAEFLKKNGAKRDLESEWWYLVTEKRSYSIVPRLKELVDAGVDVNLKASAIVSEYVPELKQKGITTLMLYAAYGMEDTLKALLELGADVNIKTADGTTALSIAKGRYNNQKIIDILLEAGAKE